MSDHQSIMLGRRLRMRTCVVYRQQRLIIGSWCRTPLRFLWATFLTLGMLNNQLMADDKNALTEIFGESNLGDVFGCLRKANRVEPEQKFDFLLQYVLGRGGSKTVRFSIDFLPTNVSPAGLASLLGAGASLTSESSVSQSGILGGEIVSPAIELVREARRSGRLDDLRELVTQRATAGAESLACSALLALVEIEARNFPEAKRHLGDVIEDARNRGVYSAERGPEGAVLTVASQNQELTEIAIELANLLWQQTLADPSRVSERWQRFVYAAANSLRAKVDLNSQGMTQLSLGKLSQVDWVSECKMTSWSCGQGLPVALWMIDKGQVRHVSGHDHDVLTYAVPLLDNYMIEADLSTFDFREIQLLAGGFWAGPGSDRRACHNGNFFKEGTTQWIEPPLTRMLDSMRVRVVVRNGFRTTFVNGRQIFQVPHSVDSDPWVGIHTHWFTHGIAKNLRIISAAESTPNAINLGFQAGLHGWIPFYGVAAQSPWTVEKSRNDASTDSSPPHAPPIPQLHGRFRAEDAGSDIESLLIYHRPMVEDGEISYEFLYRPDQTIVHPAIGRLALLLQDDGIREHWVTDGQFDRTGLRPDNYTIDKFAQRGPPALPLRADTWNRILFRLTGETIRVILNDVMVYERPIEDISYRTFGLFHYADKTEAQVRNVRHTGTWSRKLPKPEDQKLADLSLEQTIGDTSTLAHTFEHNFANGIPTERFVVTGDGWRQHFKQMPDGVFLSRPGGGEYIKFSITPKLQLEGDFDVVVKFRNFRCDVPDGLDGNSHLLLAIGKKDWADCRIYRSFNRFHPDQGEEHFCSAGVSRYSNGKWEFEHPATTAEESTSGQMRFVRRANWLYFLYAQDDSPFFRLIHKEEVGAAKTLPDSLKLVLETNQKGLTEIVWQSIRIRADGITGMGIGP